MLSNIKYIFFITLLHFTAVIDALICDNCPDQTIDNAPKIQPPSTFVEWNNHFYKAFRTGKNWETAKTICESENAYLSIINSRDEAMYVRELIVHAEPIDGSNYPGAWVGIHDYDGNANWRTINNETLNEAGYDTWWIPRQKLEKNKCGTVKICGRFAAKPCDSLLRFVCEMEVYAVPYS